MKSTPLLLYEDIGVDFSAYSYFSKVVGISAAMRS